MQAYWLVVRVLLTPPAEAAASQKWKFIYKSLLLCEVVRYVTRAHLFGASGKSLVPSSPGLQFAEGLFGSITKKDGTLKPRPPARRRLVWGVVLAEL